MKMIGISISIINKTSILKNISKNKNQILKNKKDALGRPFLVVLSYSERAVLCNDFCNNTRTYSTTTFT
ncbi:hypothetical protein, partial [Providencia rustigianii]|uniref:hypothetical protein n=2 Tax=Providencia rustigianii TaxID=158850 RepID=UPI0022430CA2